MRTGWATRWLWRIFTDTAGWRGIQISTRKRLQRSGRASALEMIRAWCKQFQECCWRPGASTKVTPGHWARERSPIFWAVISGREWNRRKETAGDNGIARTTMELEWTAQQPQALDTWSSTAHR